MDALSKISVWPSLIRGVRNDVRRI
jgi:hypothetical protein